MMAAECVRASCRLGELLAGLVDRDVPAGLEIGGVKLDSREVCPGDLFIALAGSRAHGLDFALEAARKGAAAVVYDPALAGGGLLSELEGSAVTMIAAEGLARKVGLIADRFYGTPSAKLDIVGITGTNGKTSTSHFLAQALSEEAPCALVGTLGWGFPGRLRDTRNTTPDAIALHDALARLQSEGARSVAMEVSSHGQEQGRTVGVRFKGAVFTNISRDHLDYHGTMEAYFEAKLGLLRTPGLGFLVVNLDDPYASRVLTAAPDCVAKFGFSMKSTPWVGISRFDVANLIHGHEGLSFDVTFGDSTARVESALFGDFNVENLMSTLAALVALGVPFDEAVTRIKRVSAVPGRMERFISGHDSPTVVVDYAHTPHALERILNSLRSHCRGTLWLVFGCGGDRDRGKRPQMGRIAEQWADRTVLTDDNPRSEDGDVIVQEILEGFGNPQVEVIRDREQAIRSVVGRAGADDIVVVAGKGHETSQEIQGIKRPFSDRKVVREALLEHFGGGEAGAP